MLVEQRFGNTGGAGEIAGRGFRETLARKERQRGLHNGQLPVFRSHARLTHGVRLVFANLFVKSKLFRRRDRPVTRGNWNGSKLHFDRLWSCYVPVGLQPTRQSGNSRQAENSGPYKLIAVG